MSFPAYPAYKSSRAEWLGEVPEHWAVIALKWLSPVFRGASPRPIDDPIYFDDDGEFGWVRIADVTASPDGYLYETTQRLSALGSSLSVKLEPGELFLSIAGSVGKPCITAIKACIHDGFVYFPWLSIDQRLLYRVFESGLCFGGLGKMGTQLNLNTDTVGGICIAVPPAAELSLALAFLDHETDRIDALIAEQQRLIELLKEKRQAVISHAVTKGLDPTVPMKDSGVEWLGEVPAHWKQIRIKHILSAMIDAEHKTAEYSDDGEYLVCRTTNVRNGLLSLDGAKYADRNTYIDWTRRGVPEPLDILFTREAPAGEACLVPENLKICLGQRMVLFKLDKTRIDPAFAVHSIYAGLASDFVKQLSQGSTVSHFNMADIGNIPLFEPPLSEQKGISDFLAKRCDSYDLLINEAQSSVKLISERRSALISAAVTGKIDVRGWQPPASASTPELEREAV